MVRLLLFSTVPTCLHYNICSACTGVTKLAAQYFTMKGVLTAADAAADETSWLSGACGQFTIFIKINSCKL